MSLARRLVFRDLDHAEALTRENLRDYLETDGFLDRTVFFDHHLCHAASAYYGLMNNVDEKCLVSSTICNQIKLDIMKGDVSKYLGENYFTKPIIASPIPYQEPDTFSITGRASDVASEMELCIENISPTYCKEKLRANIMDYCMSSNESSCVTDLLNLFWIQLSD